LWFLSIFKSSMQNTLPSKSSAQINSEIFNFGPDLFNAVSRNVLLKATVAESKAQHEENQVLLQNACDAVINEAQIDLKLDHRALWQVIWPRIVYAGTRASKATAEINSMRALVPLFQDLDNFSPEKYVFDEAEWTAFSTRWKERLSASERQRWLKVSATHPEWNPAAEFAQARTTPEVWKILTKNNNSYRDLLFSSLPAKVKKYLSVATHLFEDQKSNPPSALHYYTGGYEFKSTHLVNDEWVEERKLLEQVRTRFEAQLGTLTAMHTMMDMGLKTIKPDRVMTFLFSQLGWLQTLPHTWSKEEVISRYMEKDVIDEMTVRADVFAASLDRAGYSRAHRRLDIWFVKFGQEPEAAFGITTNLQEKPPGIRGVLEQVLEQVKQQDWWITPEKAAINWPGYEFRQVEKNENSSTPTGSRKSKKVGKLPRKQREASPCMSRSEAERLFVSQWKLGLVNHPDIYPTRAVNISNENKELILRMIERCIEPHLAFVKALDK
jgi:hypothetical protein